MKTLTLILVTTLYLLTQPPVLAQISPATNSFDVIIKKNGEIINGLVMEVDFQKIKYKRTDIPDGPVYTLDRSEVYAINYRNQIKDILAPADSGLFRTTTPLPVVTDTVQAGKNEDQSAGNKEDQSAGNKEDQSAGNKIDAKVNRWFAKENFSAPEVRFHIGFIRGFTKLNNVSTYAASMRFPGIGVSYDTQFKDNFRVGITFGLAGTRFQQNQYDSYDSLQIDRDLNETLLVLNLYAKRRFGEGRLRPYVLLGLGLNGSFLNSKAVFALDNASDRMIQVSSSSRALSLGIQARIGVDYETNSGLMIFGDVGAGLSVLQFGVGYRLPNLQSQKQ